MKFMSFIVVEVWFKSILGVKLVIKLFPCWIEVVFDNFFCSQLESEFRASDFNVSGLAAAIPVRVEGFITEFSIFTRSIGKFIRNTCGTFPDIGFRFKMYQVLWFEFTTGFVGQMSTRWAWN
jgi:hypothetical protein